MERLDVFNLLNTDIYCKHTYYDEMREKYIKSVYNKEPNILCIICGCSGSGKSYFEKKLVTEYSEYFNKLPQITTRKPRGKDDTGYYFVDDSIYEYMKGSLIAKLDSFNGNQYGTIPVFTKKKINTVIASYDAIEDIFKLIDEEKFYIIPILILFDITEGNITQDGKRNDRNLEFLEKERKELFNVFEKYRKQCIFSKIYKYEDYNRFAEVSDIIKI